MKKFASPAILLAYVALAGIGVPEFGAVYSLWFLGALSVLFVYSYIVVAGGRPVVSLATVFLVTLVFPLAVLAAIGWPVYQSWPALVGAFVSVTRRRQAYLTQLKTEIGYKARETELPDTHTS